MSDSTFPAALPPRTSVVRMYAAVMGVGMGCAVFIVGIYEATRPIIARNRLELRERAILDVLPNASRATPFVFTDDEFKPAAHSDNAPHMVFAGFDADQHLVGVAIEAEGKGYQDVIRVLYGYSFDKQAVIGLRILDSRETPGLGDRAETDAEFRANFQQLDVGLNDAGDALANPIEFVKSGQKQSAWQIDGISGATITTRAIAEMLRKSTGVWIPRIHQHHADFLDGPEQAHTGGSTHGK